MRCGRDSVFGFLFFAGTVAGYLIYRFASAKAVRRMVYGEDE